MGGCVSFQIKVQILAFYTDVCTAPNEEVRIEKIRAIPTYLIAARRLCNSQPKGSLRIEKNPVLRNPPTSNAIA